MVSLKAPMDGNDFAEMLEHQDQNGVHFVQADEFDEDSKQSALGGLLTAEEHVHVRELPRIPRTLKG
jgi:hypothetical protein